MTLVLVLVLVTLMLGASLELRVQRRCVIP
jgi:hypothetical protein